VTSADFGLLDPLGHGTASAELVGDGAWLQAMVDVEVALIRSLVDAGLAPEWMTDVAAAIAHARDLDGPAIASAGRAGGNPVIPLVKALSQRADAQHAGASDYVHVGATSQDILDSAAMVIARSAVRETAERLRSLAASLATLSELHRATPMAGRTLGQHASPTTLGLVAAGWLDGILGALARLKSLALPVSYGGSVGTLGALSEIVAARKPGLAPAEAVDSIVADLARRLQLAHSTAPWHSNRLAVVELGSALAAVVGAVGTIAVDVSVLSRTEIAELSERLGAGEGGSSAMPHKRNPVTAVLLVSAAKQSPGLVSTLFAAQVSEDQRPTGAWHAEWAALRQLEALAIDSSTAAASLASRLEVDVERMRSNLELTDGLLYSERVTAVLAESLGKSEAFELVAESSREAVQTRRPLQVVLTARLAVINNDDALRAKVWAAFDPDAPVGIADAIIDSVVARAKELA
jgi:3-carboxy-cis,cis-muconate cycloisomerase